MATRVLAAWEECDKTDTVFILVCTVICWTIVPTVSLLLFVLRLVLDPSDDNRSELPMEATHGKEMAWRPLCPLCLQSRLVQYNGSSLGILWLMAKVDQSLAISNMPSTEAFSQNL
jgi:hypothetical protein